MNSSRPFSSASSHSSQSSQCDRHQLEQLWHQPAAAHPAPRSLHQGIAWAKHLSQQIGQSLLDFFTGNQQLRIWQKNTASGSLWCAYDPSTNQTIIRSSETDLRAWLEQRYYRQ